jgi:hypothetical protein
VDIFCRKTWGGFVIPVQAKPEPADFNATVRTPGNNFLLTIPHPTSEQWTGKEYWRKAIPDLRKAYGHVCAYMALWISSGTGSPTVDHYIPRSADSSLAYEWSNFRLCSMLMNSRKKNYRDVLDPFIIGRDWFILDFDSMMIHPNPSLPAPTKQQILDTLKRLGLNKDEACIAARREWVDCFNAGEIDIKHLQKRAPFIAYEMKRQGLVP